MTTAALSSAQPLPRRLVSGYALGSVGTGGFGTLPGLLLAYYLTDTLGVAAGLASLAVTVPKIWDVVIDPFVGARSDADAVRRGSRRRFLLIGALTLPLLFAATFAVPAGLQPVASTVWVVVCFLAAATAFSVFQVPYIALPAEVTDSYHERTRMMTWRVAVLAVAILLFGAGGPAVRNAAGGGHRGYVVMGTAAACVIALGCLAAWWGAGAARTDAPRRSVELGRSTSSGSGPPSIGAEPLRTALRTARRDPAFRALLSTFVLQALATGAMLAGAQYTATYVLGSEAAVSILFAALVAPALLVMPVWARLGRRIGKERSFRLASTVFAASALSLLLLQFFAGPWVYAAVAVAGVGYAGMQVFPLAMLPDVVAHRARSEPGARAGTYSGVWTAGETAGLALGPALVLLVLAATGFRSSGATEQLVQPGSAVTGIVLAFSVLPAALVALSLFTFRRYRLRDRDIDLPTAALTRTRSAL